MRTKYFYQKLEERENADQAIISLKSWQNGKILKGQQEILTEFKTFYEQLYGQKNSVQERIKISHTPSWLVGMTKISGINSSILILNMFP